MKKIFFHSPIKYLTCLLIGFCLFFLYLSIQSSTSGSKVWGIIFYYVDASFVAGGTLLCFGLLAVVNHFGGFDIFTYLTSKEKRNFRMTLTDYSDKKRTEHNNNKMRLVPYFVVAALFIATSLILMLFL